ncbi:MAG: SDR family oxidoreductase [Candidatus Omnitrophica bacterium]|nr:SDR family oxidoreductase [Candidatus Omnitrophota bacterium]MDD5429921.1 SDR family oxidoreductase [Candidatus Omnitrophota bacterium]
MAKIIKKVYCIDIDGTICNICKDYGKAAPYLDRIEKINKLYDKGHTIVYFSARGSTTGLDWSELTKKQFKKWNVKYHKLILGKPFFDYCLDDKGISLSKFFRKKDIFSLANRVAIITGSSGDIGKAICEAFLEFGAIVYKIDSKDGKDVSNYKQMEKDINGIYRKEKRIDILVNCAGVTFPESSEKYQENKWNKTLSVNLKAPFKLSQIVFNYMKKTGGSIINITSLWSELGFIDNPAYGASKGGLKQLTKCLATEWAKYNIRVNNLGLGYFKTNMTKRSWSQQNLRKERTNKISLGRWGEPEDIMGTVVFLASDASRYITGQDIYVDGGWLSKGL